METSGLDGAKAGLDFAVMICFWWLQQTRETGVPTVEVQVDMRFEYRHGEERDSCSESAELDDHL